MYDRQNVSTRSYGYPDVGNGYDEEMYGEEDTPDDFYGDASEFDEGDALREERTRRFAIALEEIKEKFPSENARHFGELPNLDVILEYMAKGLSALEGYILANFEAFNAFAPPERGADKSHFILSGGVAGQAGAQPPQDVMDLYQKLNPGVSKKEIVRHWNKCMDRKG